jgi:dienelactone hydrolase
VNVSVYGQGEAKYWIFEPASPTPESAPLIIFNHGWIAMNPQNYGAWIDHMVRRGNIVVYPRYQVTNTPAEEMTQNAIIALKDAVERLQGGSHVAPQLERFAIVGHSLGGGISANMAALAVSVDLPEPKAIMFAEPGEGGNIGAHILETDLSTIPPEVLMVVVVGSEDTIAGDDIGKRIIKQTPQVPPSNKNFVSMFSDYHGDPPLVADHYAPVCPDDRYDLDGGTVQSQIRRAIQKSLRADINALDYYGFWKLFDGLTDAAFYGKNREYALGNTPEQRFMGTWTQPE